MQRSDLRLRDRLAQGARVIPRLVTLLFLLPTAGSFAAESNDATEYPVATSPTLLEIFDEELAAGARWQDDAPEGMVRDSRGFSGTRWIYLRTRDGQVSLSGLSLPIREHPEPGEYRYLSFAWCKWGGGQVALQIDRDPTQDGERRRGQLYGYRFEAGEGSPVAGQSLRLSEVVPERWTEVTRDLWQEFGDFTVTGLTFIGVEGRDAGLDRIYVARTQADLRGMPPTSRQGKSKKGVRSL